MMSGLLVALLVATELVHSVWLVRLPVAGQIIDPALPLVIAIAFRRPAWGPTVGLGVGLLQDLLFGGSLGLYALVKLLVGYGAAALGRVLLVDQPALPWVITAVATLLHQVVLVLVLAVAGLLPVGLADLGAPLLAQVALNLVAVWPAFALARLLLRGPAVAQPREGLRGL